MNNISLAGGGEWLPYDAWDKRQREAGRHSRFLADRLDAEELPVPRDPESFVLSLDWYEAEWKRHRLRWLNAQLRAMSRREQRRVQITAALRKDPAASDRSIARLSNCRHETVGKVRAELLRSGEIATFIKRRDPRSGRLSQPARKQRRAPLSPLPAMEAI